MSIETSIKNLTVDLADFGRYQNTVTVMQGDNGTRFARVTVLNDGHTFDLSNVFPVLRGTKSDGTTIFNECSVVDNKVMVELTQNILAVAGMGRYEIALYSGTPTPGSSSNQIISAFPFCIYVVKSSFDATNMEVSNEWTVLDEAMQNIPMMAELDEYIEDVNGYNDRITALENALDGHTVGANVPSDAVFTDTTYDPATTTTDGLMSSDDKAKINNISNGAEVNQNAFSYVSVGQDTVAAGTKTDILHFVGEGVSVNGNNEIVFDGGGSGIEEDIISLDSVDTGYDALIVIYQPADSEHGIIESVDHRPKTTSYPKSLIIDLYQETESNPTPETFVPFTIYDDLGAVYHQTLIDGETSQNIEQVEIPIQSISNLYYKPCSFSETQYSYKYFYFYRDMSTFDDYEIWSNYPIVYDNVNSVYGVFYYYDGSVLKNAEENLSIEDYVQYASSEKVTQRNYALDMNNCQTNIICCDANTYDSEVIEFLNDQATLSSNESTYGCVYDYVNSVQYEKYLVIPQWFNCSGIESNPLIESCLTHDDENINVDDFVVYKYKNPCFYRNMDSNDYTYSLCICTSIVNTSGFSPIFDIKNQILIDNIDIPNGQDYYAAFHIYHSSDDYKVKMHVEYSDNSLVYQPDIQSLPYLEYISGYLQMKTSGLGNRVKCNALITYDPIGYHTNTYSLYSRYEQYLTDAIVKTFPMISDENEIYGSSRNRSPQTQVGIDVCISGSSNTNTITLTSYSDLTNGTIVCPYNNRNYKYTYYLSNPTSPTYATYEIYSNYVLVCLSGAVYYLNPGTSYLSDELVALTVPESDDDYYWLKTNVNSGTQTRFTGATNNLNMWPSGNRYWYGTNMLYFGSESDALSYATYYYDHAIGYPSARTNVDDYYGSFYFGKIDVKNKLFYPLNFMKAWNSTVAPVGTPNAMGGVVYWYQADKSNDPDSPLYVSYAYPTANKPIMFTRVNEIPYKLSGFSEKDFIVESYHDNRIWINSPINENYSDSNNLITFYYCDHDYVDYRETTAIRKDIYDLKDMIISSLNGSY